MSDEQLTTLQIDVSTREILRRLATQDERSMAAEFRWMVAQEWARRFSAPQPVITIEQAQSAAEATK